MALPPAVIPQDNSKSKQKVDPNKDIKKQIEQAIAAGLPINISFGVPSTNTPQDAANTASKNTRGGNVQVGAQLQGNQPLTEGAKRQALAATRAAGQEGFEGDVRRQKARLANTGVGSTPAITNQDLGFDPDEGVPQKKQIAGSGAIGGAQGPGSQTKVAPASVEDIQAIVDASDPSQQTVGKAFQLWETRNKGATNKERNDAYQYFASLYPQSAPTAADQAQQDLDTWQAEFDQSLQSGDPATGTEIPQSPPPAPDLPEGYIFDPNMNGGTGGYRFDPNFGDPNNRTPESEDAARQWNETYSKWKALTGTETEIESTKKVQDAFSIAATTDFLEDPIAASTAIADATRALNDILSMPIDNHDARAAKLAAAQQALASGSQFGLPQGVQWDANSGDFVFNQQLSVEAEEQLRKLKPYFKAQQQVYSAVQAEYNLMQTVANEQAQIDQEAKNFRKHMETAEIDSAEEALARQRIAETRLAEAQAAQVPMGMLMQLIGNPFLMAMAQQYGLIDVLVGQLGSYMPKGFEQLFGGAGLKTMLGGIIKGGQVDVQAFYRADDVTRQVAMAEWMRMNPGKTENDFVQAIQSALPGAAQSGTQIVRV